MAQRRRIPTRQRPNPLGVIARYAASLLVVVQLLLLGCARDRMAWRAPWSSPEPNDERLITEQSTVGQIRRLNALAERASQMSEVEASEAARALNREMQANPPLAVKMAMVQVLGRLETPASIEGLRMAVADEAPRLREEACRALAKIDSPAAMDLLTETAAGDTNSDVKLAAVRGLGRYRNPRALQTLGRALDDRDPAVQYLAMESLERVTGERLGQDVRKWKELAQRPDFLRSTEDEVLRR